MWLYLGIALLAAGVMGLLVRSVEFVRVTIPDNLGSNPGFGAYESMVIPWYLIACCGLGLVTGSWRWALLPAAVGLFALGFVAMALGRLFGRRS